MRASLDKVSEAAKLLTAAIAVYGSPDPATLLKSGTSAYDSLTKLLKQAPPGLRSMAHSIAAEATQLFEGFGKAGENAPALYEQMIHASLPDAAGIVAAAMDADRLCDAMLVKLTDREHQAPPMPALFRAITVPALQRLLANRDFAADLTPAFMREVLRGQNEILLRIETTYGSLANALDSLSKAKRDELEAIASRFDIDRPYQRTDSELRAFLGKKAEEYRAFREQIEAIDRRTVGLGNLKAAAKDAAERLDFAEVEALLSRVDWVETEIAAETKVLRARNALMLGRAEDAFRHLTAAADGFAGIDPLEPARRQIRYEDLLSTHGIRYGGPGLALAARMLRLAVSDRLRQADPRSWADGCNRLAVALEEQGKRSSGSQGTALLAEAATSYRAALEISTRADHQVNWATTMQNLANTLRDQGSRTAGLEGARLFAEAAEAYRAALEVRTRADRPVDWALTMQNYAVTLRKQGDRSPGPEGTILLAQAADAYRAALEVVTSVEHPVLWAGMMHNLANALRQRGERTPGPHGIALLAEASTCYCSALEVATRAAHPVDWARTIQNLANALGVQGSRSTGPEGARLFAEASACFRAALEVRTRAGHPVEWANTQKNMAMFEQSWARHPETDDPKRHLRSALVHVEAALEVYDPKHMPYDHGTASALREDILKALNG